MNLSDIQSGTILVVDDNSENLGVIHNILSNYNLNILMAQTGNDALEIINEQKPDLILLDIRLPDIDGFEICQRLKENEYTADIPILFISILSDINDKVKGFKVGGIDYITKPFNEEEVLARILTHLTIQKQKETLKELNARKNKVFSIIAHDLKGPIGSVDKLSQLLMNKRKTMSEQKIEELIGIISNSISNIHIMLENLLHWSIFETNDLEEKNETLSMHNLVEDIIKVYTEELNKKSLTITNTIDPNISICARELMIKTVIRNLLSNAIKFSYPDTVISFTSEKTPEFLEVSIIDQGKGIDPEILPMLFNIGEYQLGRGTSGEMGSGLGLMLCKEFIESHGGTIVVTSEHNKGTKFTFSLPLKANCSE